MQVKINEKEIVPLGAWWRVGVEGMCEYQYITPALNSILVVQLNSLLRYACRFNSMECQQVASYLQQLNDTSNRTGLSMSDIGVITPYHK